MIALCIKSWFQPMKRALSTWGHVFIKKQYPYTLTTTFTFWYIFKNIAGLIFAAKICNFSNCASSRKNCISLTK